MKLESTFSVPADVDRVFNAFLDAPTMRSCIPGCEELIKVDEEHFTGRLVNEVAHVRFNATFSVEIVEIEPPRKVKATLKGEDNKLASSLRLDAGLFVEPNGQDSSEVSYSMEMAMWGKLGRMGESIFRRRTTDVEREFVQRFSAACAPEAAAVQSTEPAYSGQARKPEPYAVPTQQRPSWGAILSSWLKRLRAKLTRRSRR